MGNILKYCSSCEESFAQEFSFCPNCANELATFEMKPVSDKASSKNSAEIGETVEETPEVKNETEEKAPAIIAGGSAIGDGVETLDETEPVSDETVFEPVAFESEETDLSEDEEVTEIDVEEPAEESDSFVAAPPIVADKSYAGSQIEGSFFADSSEVERPDQSNEFEYTELDDDDYEITVIQETGLKVRNTLLLGATFLVLTVSIVSLGYSLFNHPLFLAAIGGADLILAPVDIAPLEIEEEPEKKNNDDDDGGGGGGGKERKTPPSKGQLPSQTRDKIPFVMPMEMMSNPSIPIINRTDGDIKRKKTDRTGLPTGLTGAISSGPGTGGGIGTGRGRGIGSGIGTGEGSGIGSGSGSGRGRGSGRGTGRGTGRGRGGPPKPKVKRGPTVAIRILSKPRPAYTDKARQNNVQGMVMLRVTFLSSGRIGNVAAVKRLPHGLTSKAIAAARRIRFKPALKNGTPITKIIRIQYNFTIY